MSPLVWIVAYLGLYFGVLQPAFGTPEGFLETLGMIALAWVVAEFVQGIFDVITGRS